MTFLSHAIDTAMTQLTKHLLDHQVDHAETLVCAYGVFYRAEMRLVPAEPNDLPDYLRDA